MEITIIHNSRCSKSRDTLALIESHGHTPKVIDYLNGGLTRDLLKDVLKLLNIPAIEILRTKEEEYKALSIDESNQDEVIEAILKQPKLLERPIVISGEKAVIGRPPENVLKILATS